MNKTIDLISLLNEHEAVKIIESARTIKVKSMIAEYEKCLSMNKPDMAYDIKKYINWYWETKDKEILKYKSDFINKELDLEQYARKLEYMANGTGQKELFDPVFAESSRAARGYLIITQLYEDDIVDGVTTVKDLLAIQHITFTVFRPSEIDLNKRPYLGEVLYFVGANGNLKKIRGNYDTSD